MIGDRSAFCVKISAGDGSRYRDVICEAIVKLPGRLAIDRDSVSGVQWSAVFEFL